MIRNSLFISATLLCLAVFGLMNRLQFLAPSKKLLFLHCGPSMVLYCGMLGLNLFSAALAVNRKLLLKDTGRKLSHLDNQLQAASNEDITRSLREWR